MIAFVTGRVTHLRPGAAVVDVGGIGIEVQCAPGTLAGLRQQEMATVATSLVVREDSLTLFGFADEDERATFELLQTASGVGPKLAQAMLAVHGPEALRRAVASEDLATLTKVPGVGRKGAQRIVLELKDRLGAPSAGASLANGRAHPSRGSNAWRDQVHAGLVGLGWSVREAESAVDAVAPQTDASVDRGESPDVAVLLRAALQHLAKA